MKVVQTLSIGTKRSNRLKFTPDGKRVLVSDLDGNEVVVIDVVSRKEVKRVKMGRTPEAIYSKASAEDISLSPTNQSPYGTKK